LSQEGLTWSKERQYRQIFSDEVWAHGGAHAQSYVTAKEDGSDRYNRECVQHKYGKQPAWMFYRTIVAGVKGLACFWEKEWGSMNSEKYDAVILNNIQAFIQGHQTPLGGEYIWMQDGASSHRSMLIQANL
jgi:hypothetical protein